MGYRQALVFRWSRRDRLAVLVIAVTIAFLTGATLLGLAMSSQTTAIAAEFGSQGTVEYHSSAETARASAAPGAVVLPATTVAVDGEERTVVGVPSPPPQIDTSRGSYTLPGGEDGVLATGGRTGTVERTVETPAGQRQVALAPRGDGDVVPDDWYVTTAPTVERLGPTGAFVLTVEGGSGALPDGVVPLVSALSFFVLGTRQLIDLLVFTILAGGVLVTVTVFSVTRVAVEDRRDTIAVVRSTGATPWTVYGLFSLRAVLLSAVGVALGYAVGLVLVRTVINTAVFAGLSTSLTVTITGRAVEVLLPTTVALVGFGGVAGVVAARPTVRPPPATVARPQAAPRDGERGLGSRLLPTSAGSRLQPALLEWDALVPSMATLTVFVTFVLLIAAAGSVVAPLTTTEQETITEGDAEHPINSRIPAAYAETLRRQGIAASPERLLFEAAGDEPFVARGVNYTAYESLSDPTIVTGRAPERADEAVIGADLQGTLGVGVGDQFTLGGSTAAAFTRVRIVGVFTGAGIQDDQLLVSLETAAHLAGESEERVNFIRTERLPSFDGSETTITVLETQVRANETATRVRLRVQNYGLSPVDETLAVELGGETRRVDVDLRPGRQEWVTVRFAPRPDGEYTLRAGGFTQSIRVGGPAGTLAIEAPGRIPTGTEPVIVVSRDGRPVSGATVAVVGGEVSRTTGEDGAVQLAFDRAGTYTLRADASGATTTTTVDVGPGVEREFATTIDIRPSNPSVATQPTAIATLRNPWNQSVTRTVTLVHADRTSGRDLTLEPGGSERVRLQLPYRPAGTYTVTALQNGRSTTATTYRVQGDERLAAALASSGRRSSGGGIAQAVSVVFGNVRILVAALVLLVGLMTVGATTASFARSIHAARDEVGVRRAVGASPLGIYRLVVADALRIGGVSALLAVAIGGSLVWGLLTLGELRLYGIALRPTFSPALLLGAAGTALALALVSVTVATVSLVRASPASLLAPVQRRAPDRRTGERRTGSEEVSADD